MKILRSIALVIGLSIILFNASAQQRSNMNPEQMAQKQTNRVKQNVTGITADQESKILAVEQEFTTAMQDARNSSNGDREAMRGKIKPLRETRDTKIKAILTGDQFAQYQKMEESRREGGRGRGNE